jgi:hypothetical protein
LSIRCNRLTRQPMYLCLGCARYRSVFAFRGRVRADAHHNLCPRCYRAYRQRLQDWFVSPGLMAVLTRTVLRGARDQQNHSLHHRSDR